MGTEKMEESSGAVSSLRRVFILFGEYLKHFGLFSTTVAIALLACALKGYLQLVVALHKVVHIIQRWVVIEVFRMHEYAI